ncbi:serine hydrolase domain-containing protein [Kribbella sp. NPDC056951]|uniref:serine hydrolase domain-containing protein n=1 Tax=Kribbella sp. NPDC056951 TaxID=3345978 RepID=UPI0036343FAD
MSLHQQPASSKRSGLSRRTVLAAAAAAVPVTALTTTNATAAPVATKPSRTTPLAVGRLFDKVEAGMAKYAIPGVGLGVWYRGREYVRGFGVTNVDKPAPVTADTVFRIGSTSKTFTATVMMQLVDRGLVDLDRPVRAYLPDFATADPTVGPRVTVRQLLNHSAGWRGDTFVDTGDGDDGLARYVALLSSAPQITPLGKVFSYNNAAIGVAGRVIEAVTGKPYETATRQLLIDPLGLAHSRFFLSELGGFSVAASHNIVDGKPVVEPSFDPMPRSLHAIGGLISSAQDQLRYARFQLGHPGLPRLLRERTRVAMQSNPGPGGTLFVELDGVGIGWMIRPTAEGVKVIQHGGDWPGQHSGFLMVPKRDFALTVLTNSESGPELTAELFADDWALAELAGVHNLPAVQRPLPPKQLAPYEGKYVATQVGVDGVESSLELDLTGDQGQLLASVQGQQALRLGFYRRDYVLMLALDGTPTHTRANFIPGPDGKPAFLRLGGRLFRHQTTAARSAAGRQLKSLAELTSPVR